jgi:N-acetylglutamate synthase-like GNAT family acetyltransferase
MATIRRCRPADFAAILAIVNDAAQAYRGHIPADRWHEPYMAAEELEREIAAGVAFWGCEETGALAGVMGLQDVRDIALIRHAYVATAARGRGIGGLLLTRLVAAATRPMLVGTWAAATWAVRFYERHGFRLVSAAEKERLLRAYWAIPDRQIETSVVLADARWRRLHPSSDTPREQEDPS